jgi:hypothetical protein
VGSQKAIGGRRLGDFSIYFTSFVRFVKKYGFPILLKEGIAFDLNAAGIMKIRV